MYLFSLQRFLPHLNWIVVQFQLNDRFFREPCSIDPRFAIVGSEDVDVYQIILSA